jgi:hypothetical protein
VASEERLSSMRVIHKSLPLKLILTAWNRVLLEKLIVAQPFKKYPTVFGTRRFITKFTRAHHWPLS